MHDQHLPWELRLGADRQVHSLCRSPAPCAQRPDLGPQGQCSVPALHRDVCGSCLKAELLPWHWADGGGGGVNLAAATGQDVFTGARSSSKGPGAAMGIMVTVTGSVQIGQESSPTL